MYPDVNPTVFFTDPAPFTKHETSGYSLNGKEILAPQGGSYELIDDTSEAVASGETGYVGTTAAILWRRPRQRQRGFQLPRWASTILRDREGDSAFSLPLPAGHMVCDLLVFSLFQWSSPPRRKRVRT